MYEQAQSMALAEKVADMLCAEAATDVNFFWRIAQRLESKGYQLIAEQRGIGGTYLRIAEKADVS